MFGRLCSKQHARCLRTVCKAPRSQGLAHRYALQQRGQATYTSPAQAAQISVIPTAVEKSSQGYQENEAAMKDVCARFEDLHRKAALGGPQKARDKHVQRGKMLVRE